MSNSRIDIPRMRRCFEVTDVWCGWTELERKEIGAEIRAAIDSGDEALITFWRDWLEDMSGLERMAALCRAAEDRIKAARRAA